MKLLTVRETLSILRISRATLYGLLKKYPQLSIQLGRRRLIDAEKLQAILEKGRGHFGEDRVKKNDY